MSLGHAVNIQKVIATWTPEMKDTPASESDDHPESWYGSCISLL
jgi:hypothetical protein